MTERIYRDPPRGISSLRQRLKNVTLLEDGLLDRRLRTMAAIVVAQLLPPSLVKGGTSMTLRKGAEHSRSSADVDVTRLLEISEEEFVHQFRLNAAQGWSGFQGVVTERPKRRVQAIPDSYIVLPLDVRLAYRGSFFRSIHVEIAINELAEEVVEPSAIPSDIVDLFVKIGLDRPEPVALLPAEFQIAQKLHACTTPDSSGANQRAHDLVDLQLLGEDDTLDFARLARAGRQLFAIRKSGIWPPEVLPFPQWEDLYNEAAKGLRVRPFGEALKWANELVTRALLAEAGGDQN